MHPVHFFKREEYERLFTVIATFCARHENTEWDFVSSLSYEEIFSIADLHLTFFSMLSYEAAFFGIRTIMLELLKDHWCDGYFDELEADGYLERIFIDSPELSKLVASLDRGEPRALSSKNDTHWRAALIEIAEHIRNDAKFRS
jgi:hypothetical protein